MSTISRGESVSDEKLVRAVALRDQAGESTALARDSFEQLYLRHAPSLLAFLLSRTSQVEAEDIHQLTWLRALESLPHKKPGSFRGWLFQIARNTMIDEVRKKRPDRLSADQAGRLDGGLDPPDFGLVEHEEAEALKVCLGKLPAQMAAVARARLGGEDSPTIAQSLGITTNQVHGLFHKAKTLLKSCVERTLS